MKIGLFAGYTLYENHMAMSLYSKS